MPSEIVELSKAEARHICVVAQFPQITTTSAKAVRQLIEHLGYVQIDTISVIERAHQHILFSRAQDYQPALLHQLQKEERAIFEYWGHAMSYLPMRDFRYFLPRMQRMQNPQRRWAKSQLKATRHLLKPVLERIREEGPLSAQDFKEPRVAKSNGWWDWKPAKMALELLFWRGDLMVTERIKFNKVYDLTERVLPAGLNLAFPEPEEIADYLVCGAIRALGLADRAAIFRFLQPDARRDSDLLAASGEDLEFALQRALAGNQLVMCRIEGLEDTWFTSREALQNGTDSTKNSVKLLSPFDNLIIQRKRLKQLFDFDYALECYLPQARRRFGYFVLPILWGDEFVGRVDPKVDRKNGHLLLQNLQFESGFHAGEKFLNEFRLALKNFACFNGCHKIRFVKAGKLNGNRFPWRVINL